MNNMFNEIIHSQASGQVHQILKPMTREEIISNPDECLSRIQKLQEAIQQYNDNYFKDKNSSSVREQVICEKLGYQHSKKKLGDDGFIEKKNNDGSKTIEGLEVKPKMAHHGKPLDGGGNFSDFTWARHHKHLSKNTRIAMGGFNSKNKLMYIVTFPYSDITEVVINGAKGNTGLTQKLPNGDRPSTYVRSISWSWRAYRNAKNVQINFLTDDDTELSKSTTKPFYKWLKNKNQVTPP